MSSFMENKGTLLTSFIITFCVLLLISYSMFKDGAIIDMEYYWAGISGLSLAISSAIVATIIKNK